MDNQTMGAVIGSEQVRQLMGELRKYKAGKARTEGRIIASENWWKLRNGTEEARKSAVLGDRDSYRSCSGWLHNVLASKHADMMAAYPEPTILPREPEDVEEAQILTAILPCILEQNDFEATYSDAAWQKVKTGTGVYKITWDTGKLNGLGDISIRRVNLLNLYWEPGVTDIQQSKYFFHTELQDREVLQAAYPALREKLNGQAFLSSRFLYDDTVDTSDKLTVIECYYKKQLGARQVLHYVKFAADQVLYATENDPQWAQRGLYDHGQYPFVFDALFPIEGSPCGYGYVDLCRSPQTTIDLLNTGFIKNAMAGATPRYFKRQDGGVNEEEFLDLTRSIVNVDGNLGEDALRQIPFQPLDGVYVSFLDRVIQELRETSGNTETSTGNISSGVTAASAIAALQEASGKGSRDSSMTSYRAFRELMGLCIELVRQFYQLPRQFRIVGNHGARKFITYTNRRLQGQSMGAFGIEGLRLPVFDIKIGAQKKSAYSRVAQNELALQLYQMGFFNPQMTDQALMCLDMMDFEGKDALMEKLAQQGTVFQKLIQYMKLSLTLAAKSAPEMVEGLSREIMATMGAEPSAVSASRPASLSGNEHPYTERARQSSAEAPVPEVGA